MGRRITFALAIAIAAALAACDRQTEQRVDNAVDRTQSKLESAGDRIAEAGSKVANTVKEAVKVEPTGLSATGGPGTPTTTNIKTGPESSVSGLPERTREALEDTAITTAIKAGFVKEPGLSALKIDVDTRDGVVTLNGLADSDDAKRRAEQVASSTRGVKEVRNHLAIKQG